MKCFESQISLRSLHRELCVIIHNYHTKAVAGFSDEVDKQLIEAAKILTCPEQEKYVVIIMDEMHIKEDLVYDKHTGML